MSCPIRASHYEPIADEIVDKTTSLYPNHSVYTHLGCALLRVVLGSRIIGLDPKHNRKSKKSIMFILVLVLIVFGSKLIYTMVDGTNMIWKVYLRTLIAYTTALYMLMRDRADIAGTVVIVDALMGVQSRHMASTLSCGIKK